MAFHSSDHAALVADARRDPRAHDGDFLHAVSLLAHFRPQRVADPEQEIAPPHLERICRHGDLLDRGALVDRLLSLVDLLPLAACRTGLAGGEYAERAQV